MAADAARNGMHRRVLSREQVDAIRREYRPRKRPYLRDYAEQHGVSIMTIHAIVHGTRYKVF